MTTGALEMCRAHRQHRFGSPRASDTSGSNEPPCRGSCLTYAAEIPANYSAVLTRVAIDKLKCLDFGLLGMQYKWALCA